MHLKALEELLDTVMESMDDPSKVGAETVIWIQPLLKLQPVIAKPVVERLKLTFGGLV